MNPVEYLIEEVRRHSFLYDASNDVNRCLPAKKRVWNSIAAKLNVTPEYCKQRWRSLRDGYIRRKHMANETARKGEKTEIEWPYYDRLAFLDEYSEVLKNGSSTYKSKWKKLEPESSLQVVDEDTVVDGNCSLKKRKKVLDEGETELSRDMRLDIRSVELLIEEVRRHPDEVFSKNFAVKGEFWEKAASKLNIKPEQCKNRWRSLRDGYIRRKHKANENATNGIKTDVEWRYFDKLQFLDDYCEVLKFGTSPYLSSISKPGSPSIQMTDEEFLMDSDSFSQKEASDITGDFNSDTFADEMEMPEVIPIQTEDDKSDGDFNRCPTVADGTETLFVGLARQMEEAGMPKQTIVSISSRVTLMVHKGIEDWLESKQFNQLK